jgi:hypothetical protein
VQGLAPAEGVQVMNWRLSWRPDRAPQASRLIED